MEKRRPSALAHGARGLALSLAALCAVACAGRSAALSRDLDSLRTRVAELEAARRRGAVDAEEISTRLQALEARLEHAKAPAPRLPIVRLSPEEAPPAEPEQIAEPEWTEPPARGGARTARRSDEEERPVLRLHERPGIARAAVADARPVDLVGVSERLPVVPMPEVPMGGGAPALAPAVEEPQEPAAPDVGEMIEQARGQAASGACSDALSSLGEALTRSPEHPLADDAMLIRGRCLRSTRQSLRAVGELERLLQRYPSSDQTGEALLEMAEAYNDLGDVERARQLFSQVMRRFPSSRAAGRATARVQQLAREDRAREDR